jgi:predicted nucleic acid-binding protein
MRIVLDTNVLVSAFLNYSGAPAQVLTLVLAGELKLVFDRRILDEYAGCLHVRALVSIQRT